jgi:EAL and modified HD-GYP domain-containing signal transduction protein
MIRHKMHSEAAIPQVLVARQPICDANGRTFGYELLYRSSMANHANVRNGEEATARVVLDAFMEFGMDRMVGNTVAFINVTRDFIVGEFCRALPRDRVVLEVLENTVADSDTIRELSALSNAGYKIALDDFVFQENSIALLPISNFVKVDLRNISQSSLDERLYSLRRFNVRLLAEKVETYEEFEFCRQRGFDYFQGHFFARPNIMAQRKVPMNRVAIFRLLAKLCDPNVGPSEVVSIIGEDLALSYKLLRYINSAWMSLPRKIDSITHAVRLIGTERIRTLANLIMLSGMDEKPSELMTMSMIRAKMCESVALALDRRDKEVCFTVGLLSILDAFLDCTMEEALAMLPLSDHIRAALLTQEGEPGTILKGVLLYEKGDWAALDSTGIRAEILRDAYLQSVEWSQTLINSFPTTPNP